MTVRDDIAEIESWFQHHQPAFADVPPKVKANVYHFILVFSLFDQRHLNASGSRDDVITFIDRLPQNADFTPYQPYLDYFQHRYIRGGQPTHHYELLVDQDDVSSRRILDVLAGHSNLPAEKIGALVLIAYRLRCNLVHGSKWQTGLGDQYHNLMNAARVVMLVMDRDST